MGGYQYVSIGQSVFFLGLAVAGALCLGDQGGQGANAQIPHSDHLMIHTIFFSLSLLSGTKFTPCSEGSGGSRKPPSSIHCRGSRSPPLGRSASSACEKEGICSSSRNVSSPTQAITRRQGGFFLFFFSLLFFASLSDSWGQSLEELERGGSGDCS